MTVNISDVLRFWAVPVVGFQVLSGLNRLVHDEPGLAAPELGSDSRCTCQ